MISIYFITFLGTVVYASHEVAIGIIYGGYWDWDCCFGNGRTGYQSRRQKDRFGCQPVMYGIRSYDNGDYRGYLCLIPLFRSFPVYHRCGCYFYCRISYPPAALEQITIAVAIVLQGIIKGFGDTHTPMLVTHGAYVYPGSM